MSADLGKRLTELRKYSNITREDLARRMSVKPKDVIKWENGSVSPDGDQLIKLSRIYQMPIDEILLNFDTDEVFDPSKAQENENPAAAIDSAKNFKPINPSTAAAVTWYAFPYPIIVVLAFLMIGFLSNMWHPAWMLFLTIPVYYMFVNMIKS